MVRLLTLALAASLVASGCGSKDQSVQRRLGDDTAAVVRALNAKDVPAAGRALAALDADITAAGRLEQLSPAQVTDLRATVTALRSDLTLLAPKVTATPTPARTTTTTRPPSEEGKKKHGKGHGDD